MFHFTLFVKLSFFLTFNARIDSLQQSIRSTLRESILKKFEEAFKCCRELQLLILLFNHCNSSLIFGYKLFCLNISIVSIYLALRLFPVHPLISSCCLYIGVYTMVGFVIIYDKAFVIPQKVEDVKAEMIVALKSNCDMGLLDRIRLEKQLRSIRDVGVKCGNFSTLERYSSLVFLHFVITSIASLLVSSE
ncbi:unnamed protein product [Allacma fusca]|uniref:Uncharacterized protein n=1 Tax=Allacma fusca TaxID=39272 RepID=A0A8J2JWY7_9HEXA|nr:unnamed protein product [Allacma fusca]